MINRTLKFYQLARSIVGVILVVIPISMLYGRTLVNNFPILEKLLPYVALLIILGTSLLALQIKRNHSVTFNPSGKPILVRSLFTLLILLSIGVLAETMILLPIESIHLIKYGCLGFFLYYSKKAVSITVWTLLVPIIVGCAIGTVDETLQLLVPNRIFDPRDILLNCLSATLGTLLAFSFRLLFFNPDSTTSA